MYNANEKATASYIYEKSNSSLIFLDLLNISSIKDSGVQCYNANENGGTCYTYVKVFV